MLKFSKGNSKLGNKIYTFSLLSGWSCPNAKDCMSKAVMNESTNKLSIQDGPDTKFRCFSASQEAQYKGTYAARKHNFDLVKKENSDTIVNLIKTSLPKKSTIIRIHVAGDFFNQKYFDAWLQVAREMPNIIFYAYTKSIAFWVARLNEIPSNLKLNASRGGRQDHLIDEYGLKEVVVVYSEKEAEELGLEIDHDDTHAYKGDKSFALLIHGTQPKGSEASIALKELKKEGWTGYKKEKGRTRDNNLLKGFKNVTKKEL
jgi:hypothetical protein